MGGRGKDGWFSAVFMKGKKKSLKGEGGKKSENLVSFGYLILLNLKNENIINGQDSREHIAP